MSNSESKKVISEKQEVRDIGKKEKFALYTRSVTFSISNGLVQPFVSMIALTMGASSGLLGWIQSISNLLSTFLTPLFGRLSDLAKRRIPFIVISTITWGIPYAFLYFVKPSYAWTIVIVVALVNLLLSLGVPAWTALQNELFPKEVRGKLTARVFCFNSIGSVIATIFTGIILTTIFDDQDYQKFILIPVAVGIFLSILGILPFRKVEEPLKNMDKEEQPIPHKLKESFKIAFANKPFAKFTIVSVIQSLFFSFAWPLFSIFQISVLGATAIEVAILSISFSIMMLIVIRFGAKLSDRFGRTRLIFFNRFALALFPLAYMFATQVWHLYIIHYILAGVIFIGMPSLQAYLLDIIPPKEGGMYFGIYNMLTGVALFIGALAGGYIAELSQFLFDRVGIGQVLTSSIN
ncbi:MAG: MFS transporter, partial [Candidatus Heimdallarchaeaceae archaeon]